jgi:hypothetical protein
MTRWHHFQQYFCHIMDVCFNNEENDGTPEQTTIRSWPQTPGSKKTKNTNTALSDISKI